MPPPKQKSQAIAAPKGTKKTFNDDEDDFEILQHAESSSSRKSKATSAFSDEDEEDSDDDKPEAVGMSMGKSQAMKDIQAVEELARSKKAAERARNQKIAALKAREAEKSKATRSVGKKTAEIVENEDDNQGRDEESRRLKARMQKAMAAGEGESEDDSELDSEDRLEDEDELDDEDEESDGKDDEDEIEDDFSEGQSFHTDSDEDDEEEESGTESDGSETLEEGPIDSATRQMYERMQAAMEAAERRAGIIHPSKLKPTTPTVSKQVKPEKSEKMAKRKAEVIDEETMWDLGAGTGDGPAPLSSEALKKAEEEDREMKRRKKEKQEVEAEKKKAAERGAQQKKKKVVKEQPVKKIGGKTVHILQPTLDPSTGGLPPIIGAGSKIRGQAAGQASKRRFVKTAMNSSGLIPGKARVDGRRKPMGLEARS